VDLSDVVATIGGRMQTRGCERRDTDAYTPSHSWDARPALLIHARDLIWAIYADECQVLAEQTTSRYTPAPATTVVVWRPGDDAAEAADHLLDAERLRAFGGDDIPNRRPSFVIFLDGPEA